MYSYPIHTTVQFIYHGTVQVPRYTLPGNLGPPFRGLPIAEC